MPFTQGASAPICDDPEVLEALLNVEPGWASDLELSWNIAGNDLPGRRRVRLALTALARSNALDHLYIRHHGEPLAITKIDPDAIRALLDGAE